MDFPGLPERYCITSKLGTGSFATVWNAIDLETNSTVAVKVIPHDPGNRTVCEERIANELHINQVVHHKHIANLLDHYEDDKNSYLINELCCKGTLGDLVLELGMIPENELRKYFIKILKVLKYLHEEVHIIHRDIKIDNIMFDAKNTLKLIDFGLSIEHYPGDPGLTKCCGSPSMYFSLFFYHFFFPSGYLLDSNHFF
ncbi:hypothetical protein TRFO_33479 [Tritrichomonas foetus]|uniref:Protein kinase domain-containing protein n=1 Tax=Tritrichomonas foetus TaxID=1144522 RepID=A0A1J4JR24_9EUKA|nr:hypothetical protein TRFO_33479 [Tritrichomonas foetus]|eukprot:OHS99965.1 hypothetical protein TRFO_33479 [Tritrichomonas foetus]